MKLSNDFLKWQTFACNFTTFNFGDWYYDYWDFPVKWLVLTYVKKLVYTLIKAVKLLHNFDASTNNYSYRLHVIYFKRISQVYKSVRKKWLNATVDFLTIFFSILKEIEVHNANKQKPV